MALFLYFVGLTLVLKAVHSNVAVIFGVRKRE